MLDKSAGTDTSTFVKLLHQAAAARSVAPKEVFAAIRKLEKKKLSVIFCSFQFFHHTPCMSCCCYHIHQRHLNRLKDGQKSLVVSHPLADAGSWYSQQVHSADAEAQASLALHFLYSCNSHLFMKNDTA